jgi:hypothetical protein
VRVNALSLLSGEMLHQFRNFFEFLSIFDWITPTVALIEDVTEGGPFNSDVWTFFVPNDRAIGRGWSAARIEDLLAQHGIKTWGGLLHLGEYFFKVDLEQAAWAEYILTSRGVPICPKSQGAPRPRKKQQPIRVIFDVIFGGAE